MEPNKEKWGSRWGFLLATAGSAIGLGNIWRFPYVTGVNGGAAFVCVYIVSILIVGLPLMIAELAIGRAAGCHPAWAFDRFTSGKRTPVTDFLGVAMILSGLLMFLFGRPGHAVLLLFFGIFLAVKGWKCIGVTVGVIVPFIIRS